MKPGTRVTSEPRYWYDGAPIKGWPNPQYMGTVLRVDDFRGLKLARVKYDTGRTDFVNVAALAAVKGGE